MSSTQPPIASNGTHPLAPTASTDNDPITVVRLRLAEQGYAPIPCQGKIPNLLEWSVRTPAPAEEVASWRIRLPAATNTGNNAAFTPAFDIDIDNAEIATDVEEMVREWFDGRGIILTRFGNVPRRALILRTEVPFPGTVQWFEDPQGKRQLIEVLCQGRQWIAYGIHPDSGRRYDYARGLTPLEIKQCDLPLTDEQDMLELTQLVFTMLEEKYGYSKITCETAKESAEDGTEFEEIGNEGPVDFEEELEMLSDGRRKTNRFYTRVVPHLLQKGEHPDDVLDTLVQEVMERVGQYKEPKWSEAEERRAARARILSCYRFLLRSGKYDPADGVVPDWLPDNMCDAWADCLERGEIPRIHYNSYGFCVRAEARKAKQDTNDTADDEKPAAGENTKTPEETRLRKRKTFTVHAFKSFDIVSLPPRQFLYGRHYQRRAVGMTFSPGGFGKSSLDLVEMVAMATARNLLGEQPPERLRVWVHNGEDPKEEIERRIAAICLHYKIPMTELEGWLWYSSGNEFPLKVARGYSNLDIDNRLIAKMSEFIGDNHIDVFNCTEYLRTTTARWMPSYGYSAALPMSMTVQENLPTIREKGCQGRASSP